MKRETDALNAIGIDLHCLAGDALVHLTGKKGLKHRGLGPHPFYRKRHRRMAGK